MKRVVIPNYRYQSPFGTFEIQAEVELNPSDYAEHSKGKNLYEIPHNIINPELCLRQSAFCFYKQVYRGVLFRTIDLSPDHLLAIGFVLNLNQSRLARVIGITRGSLTNFLKGRRNMLPSTQILALERLSLELISPGSINSVFKKHAFLPLEREIENLFKHAIPGLPSNDQ